MKVSIFIRSYNEAALIDQCLQAIFSQKTRTEYEVVILDSGSEDETVEIAKRFNVKIFSIPKRLFSYSDALNAGSQLCLGECFLPLSAHAIPHDETWLERLVAPLRNKPALMATFSRQVPWESDSTPHAEKIRQEFDAKGWLRDKANFIQLMQAGVEPFELLQFSNVSSCIRRDFLLEHPFYDLPFCEDRAFALDVLSANLSIAYIAESVVYHSHWPSFQENRRIARDATVARHQINGEARRRFGSSTEAPVPASKALLFMKLGAVWAYAALRATESAVLPGNSARTHEIAHYLSLPGITLGKLDAASLLPGMDTAPLRRSDPSELLLQARQIYSGS